MSELYVQYLLSWIFPYLILQAWNENNYESFNSPFAQNDFNTTQLQHRRWDAN